jgi:hypothetical protein
LNIRGAGAARKKNKGHLTGWRINVSSSAEESHHQALTVPEVSLNASIANLPNLSLIIGMAETGEMISITKTEFWGEEIKEPDMRKVETIGKDAGKSSD